MKELKKLTYTIFVDDAAPQPGQYLVTMGKRAGKVAKVLSVMLIKSVRKIKHKIIKDEQGYALEGYDQPDLKPLTEYEELPEEVLVWVRGQEALPCFWLPRGKPATPKEK